MQEKMCPWYSAVAVHLVCKPRLPCLTDLREALPTPAKTLSILGQIPNSKFSHTSFRL